MADEKKGYIRTLIDYMLVDPKDTGVGPERLRTWSPQCAATSEREMC